MGLTIAIDGPAASGKGTLARRLADYFHLRHLDTGLTYRAVAHRMMQEGWPLGEGRRAVEAAELVDLGRLDRGTLSAHAVGDAASKVAVFPEVRRILVDKQHLQHRADGPRYIYWPTVSRTRCASHSRSPRPMV